MAMDPDYLLKPAPEQLKRIDARISKPVLQHLAPNAA